MTYLKKLTYFPKFSGRDSIIMFAKEGELDILGQNVPDYLPEHNFILRRRLECLLLPTATVIF